MWDLESIPREARRRTFYEWVNLAHLVCDARSTLPPDAYASLRYDRPMACDREALG